MGTETDRSTASTITSIVFILEVDEVEREGMRRDVSEIGCAVAAFASREQVLELFKAGAVCNLLIVSTNVLDNNPANFDSLLAAAMKPAVVVYGVDPAAKLVVHCLNRGARDFLTKPFERNDLVRAVLDALRQERSAPVQPDSIHAHIPVANWIELTASSELEQFRRMQRFYDSLFAAKLSSSLCEDLKMAIEEVGRNAVEWGNHFSPDKRVHVSYCMFADRIVLKVEDEGEGFTPQALPDPTSDPVKTMQDRITAGKRPGGYGVFLLQKLVDQVFYNEKGNSVLLIKYLSGTTDNNPNT